MKYNQFGVSDFNVFEICFGIMMWGMQNSEVEVYEQMDYVFEQGVNFFDIVEFYLIMLVGVEMQGDMEKFIGLWFKKIGKCDKVIFVIKIFGCGCVYICGGVLISVGEIEKVFDLSLQCFGIDYVDFYQLYWFNCGIYVFCVNWFFMFFKQDMDYVIVELLEVLEVFEKVKKVGKICYWGVLNEMFWGVMKYQQFVDSYGLLCMVLIQNEYNLFDCKFDIDLVEVFYYEKVGFMVYFLFVVGIFSGKYFDGVCFLGLCGMINIDFGGCFGGYEELVVYVYVEFVCKYSFDLV